MSDKQVKINMGWEPDYTFEAMIHEMVDYWKEELKGK